MVWPWTLTFWPKNIIRSSVSWGAPVTKVWQKCVNRYWRYRGNIKLSRESRTDGQRHGRTTRKHSLRRLKNIFFLNPDVSWTVKRTTCPRVQNCSSSEIVNLHWLFFCCFLSRCLEQFTWLLFTWLLSVLETQHSPSTCLKATWKLYFLFGIAATLTGH